MARTEVVRARIEPTLKSEVEKLFAKLGLTATEAVRLFYRQVKLHQGLPFTVTIPNSTTLKVFEDTDANRNLVPCKDTDEMFANLGI